MPTEAEEDNAADAPEKIYRSVIKHGCRCQGTVERLARGGGLLATWPPPPQIVVVATVSTTDIFGELAPVIVELRGIGVSLRAVSELVVLSDRVVLCTQMPVDIDGAHGALPVVLGVGLNIDFHFTFVSLGDVGASLRTRSMDAVNV